MLFKSQTVEGGEVGASVSMLLVIAKQSPKLTDKVVKAGLEMHKFLKQYYADTRSQLLSAEKIAIPAMFEVLEPQIQKNVTDSGLRTRAHLLLSKVKSDLIQETEPTNRNVFDVYASAYQRMMTEKQPIAQNPQRRQKIYEI